MNTPTEKSKNTVIILLAIALLATVGYCIYLKTNAPAGLAFGPSQGGGSSPLRKSITNFISAVEDDGAVADMKRYRDHKGGHKHDGDLVIYDSADIANYFSCVWPTLTQKLTPDSGYRWAVGFYFVRKYDSTKQDTVLDFYVTPTLVSGPIGKLTNVIDFDSNAHNAKYYTHDPTKFACAVPAGSLKPADGGSGSGGNSYDAGQLWP